MMLSNLSFWIFVVSAIALVIGLGWLIKSYRDAKHASYFFLREEAALRVKRLMFVLVPLAVVVVFLGLRLFGPQEEAPPVPGETPTTTGTAVVTRVTAESDTPAPRETGTITATVALSTEEAVVPSTVTQTPAATTVITLTPVLTPTSSLTLTVTPPLTVTAAAATAPVTSTIAAAPSGALTGTVEPGPTTVVTGTVEPGSTPVITGTAEPGATAAITGTVEPSPTPTATDTPVFSTVTPHPDAEVESIVFSRAITPDSKPKNPARVFSPGDNYIYAFFEYSDMKDGVAWRHVWFRGPQELGSEGDLWEWGSDGRAYVYFSPVGGFTPGRYMVQIYIGEELSRTGTFVVR